ncbi:MAG: HlyD family type I secretion periplasmic adaptor subunit [Acidobacteriaceae bacterium]|nr:HlyD family type I secretion periplasmic adaptor subunit [Acidobacteriaceae bacterium]
MMASETSTSLVTTRDERAVMPAILEFQSPSTAIITAPIPASARGVIWMITAMFALCVVAMAFIKTDKVVTATGKVVSQAATLVVQPYETSIVRSIDVQEGQIVRAGDILARLDPTFASADVGAFAAQVASLQAEVSRLQAEVDSRPFTYSGSDPNLSLQAAIFAQRQAERMFQIENYQQQINSLATIIARNLADAAGLQQRLDVAERVEKMRRELEQMQVGSKLNTLGAVDNRIEIARNMQNAINTGETAKRDLAAKVAERDSYDQTWHADLAEKLAESARKLSDAREELSKAQLRRQLVELRADHDATVLTVAKVSVGSVLQPGEQLITLVPLDATLEIEADISGRDDGYVHVGDPVAIKFDTLPYHQYGLSYGNVRLISADSFTAQDEQASHSGRAPSNAENMELFYRSRISLDDIRLHNTPIGFHIIPGMPVTADIKVGKRTVLQYLLGRVLPMTSEAMREP